MVAQHLREDPGQGAVNSTAGEDWALLADIGGTRARFALSRAGGEPERTVVQDVGAQPGVRAALTAYLDGAGSGVRPRRAAIAVAAPVSGDRVDLTNHPWDFSRRELAAALGLDSLVVVNDFEAIARAVPHLGPGDVRTIGGGEPVPEAPVAVLGPGTGLGIALLVPTATGWTAVAGEGGHIDLAPGNEDEIVVLRALWEEFGHASIERVLSGPGLVTLCTALAARDGGRDGAPPAPDRIAAAVRSGDARALAVTRIFSALLGAAAGDLALTAGARGGVYVAGGVVGNLGDAFDADGFRARFEAKGRFSSFMAAIPTYLITYPQPGLLGLARGFAEP